jgi:hypothetical protein
LKEKHFTFLLVPEPPFQNLLELKKYNISSPGMYLAISERDERHRFNHNKDEKGSIRQS